MPDKEVELIKYETLFQGYYRIDRFQVRHERFDGGWTAPFSREVMDRGGNVVGVLLFDPQQDKVVMVEQFRPGPFARGDSPWLCEVVAGVVEQNEDLETGARREAREETGCEVRDLKKIADFYTSPGCLSEHLILYVGRTIAPSASYVAGLAQEDEHIRIHVLEAAQAISMLYSNKIRDAMTMIAMQWFALHHTDLRSRWLVSETSTPII